MKTSGAEPRPAAGHVSSPRIGVGVGVGVDGAVGGGAGGVVGRRRRLGAASSTRRRADRAPGDAHDGARRRPRGARPSSSRSAIVPYSPLVVMTSSPTSRRATSAWWACSRRCCGRMNSTHISRKVTARRMRATHGRRATLVAGRPPPITPSTDEHLGPAERRRSVPGLDGRPHLGHEVERPGQVVQRGEAEGGRLADREAGGAGRPSTNGRTPGSGHAGSSGLVVVGAAGVAQVDPARRRSGPCRGGRGGSGSTQSNRSTPRATASTMPAGSPRPIR